MDNCTELKNNFSLTSGWLNMWDWQSTIAKELNDSQDLKHKCCVAKSRCTILYDISVSRRNNFTALKKHISLLSSRVLRTEQDLFPGCQRRGWSQDKQRIPRLTNTIGSHILGNWIVIAVRQTIWGPRRINMYVFFHYPLQTASKPKLFICDIDNHDLCHRLP